MTMTFELTGNEAIFDMEKFCRLRGGLTYIGQFSNKNTSKVIPGTIIQYGGEFYTTELLGISGTASFPADAKGMVTTSVTLFETDEYVPEECKSLSDCSIRIDIWNTDIDDEGPIESYAFYSDQLAEAKEVMNSNKDVDIFFDGKPITREEFLEK